MIEKLPRAALSTHSNTGSWTMLLFFLQEAVNIGLSTLFPRGLHSFGTINLVKVPLLTSCNDISAFIIMTLTCNSSGKMNEIRPSADAQQFVPHSPSISFFFLNTNYDLSTSTRPKTASDISVLRALLAFILAM